MKSQILIAQTLLLDQKITITANSKPLYEVLNMIEKIADVSFSYNSEIIQLAELQTINAKKIPIRVILENLFSNNSLRYEILGNQIIIYNPDVKTATIIDTILHNDVVLTIEGKVIDAKSKKTLAYATIGLKGKAIGTVTNQDGEFIFRITEFSDQDTLRVSFTSYKPIDIPVSDIEQDTIIISLKMIDQIIKEVIVRPIVPKELISKAYFKIQDNYDKTSSMFTAFFRETIKQDKSYISLSEAILYVYKASYMNFFERDRIKLIKGRKNVKNQSFVRFVLQGGLTNNLKLDIVKDRVSFINEEYFDIYDYKLVDIVSLNGRNTYVIEFDQKKTVDDVFFKGKLYIDINTLAFVKTIFGLSPRGIHGSAKLLVKKRPRKLKVIPKKTEYSVNYIFNNGLWHLSNTRSEVIMKVKDRRDKINSTFTSVSEFMVTNESKELVTKFKRHEITNVNDVFVEQIGSYDVDFWGNYNIIKPDISIKEVIEDLRMNTNIVFILK